MHPIPNFRRPNASVALLGAAFAAALSVAGCSYTSTAAAAHVLHVRLSMRERGNNFEVRLPAGDITIVPGPAGRVSLRGTASYKGERQPAISFTTIGGLTVLRSACRSSDHSCGYDYTITLPPSLNAEVSTAAGNIAVSGSAGRLSLRSAAGNLTLDHVSGPLSASIGSGDVTGRALSAVSCRVQDGAGNVSLAFDLPPKNVAVQGSVGNVSVSVPLAHRYHVMLNDDQGNMSTAVPDDPIAPNKITLSESIGNVALA